MSGGVVLIRFDVACGHECSYDFGHLSIAPKVTPTGHFQQYGGHATMLLE